MSDFLAKESRIAFTTAAYSFATANIFANYEAHNMPALAVATLTAVGVLAVSRFSKNPTLPMRMNSVGMFVTAGVALAAGFLNPHGLTPDDVLTAGVDILFGVGNWLASRANNDQILNNPAIRGIKKAINHPATYYSFAYNGTALLASRAFDGGMGLHTLQAMSFDIAMTALSLTGLLSNKFKNPAASFMAVTIGSFGGALAGLFSGNIPGMINKLCSAVGEGALAYQSNAAYQENGIREGFVQNASLFHRAIDTSFDAISGILTFPVRALRAAILRP